MGDRIKVTFSKQKYGWSKYGGGRHGLVKEDLDEWYCQSCGKKQIDGMGSYMFDMDQDKRDFMRICADCKHLSILEKIKSMMTLTYLVRNL